MGPTGTLVASNPVKQKRNTVGESGVQMARCRAIGGTCADLVVQDLLRCMLANRRMVVHFKEVAQLRRGVRNASFHGILLHSTKRSSRIPNAFDQEEAAPA